MRGTHGIGTCRLCTVADSYRWSQSCQWTSPRNTSRHSDTDCCSVDTPSLYRAKPVLCFSKRQETGTTCKTSGVWYYITIHVQDVNFGIHVYCLLCKIQQVMSCTIYMVHGTCIIWTCESTCTLIVIFLFTSRFSELTRTNLSRRKYSNDMRWLMFATSTNLYLQ